MYQFITQGYACAAVVLLLGYFFYESRRADFFQLARILNILIWFFSLFYVLFCLYAILMTQLIIGNKLMIFFSIEIFASFLIVVAALPFKNIRKHSVWLLFLIAWMLNPDILTGHLMGGGWFSQLPTWPRFLLFGTVYFLLLLLIRYSIISAKKHPI